MKKTLKFNNVKVNKNEFHKSKKPIDLMSVKVNQIVTFDKFNHSDEGFKYFIANQENEITKPLCIILPQVSGYIKYFEIDTVMRMDKTNHPQVYFEECKYKLKKM